MSGAQRQQFGACLILGAIPASSRSRTEPPAMAARQLTREGWPGTTSCSLAFNQAAARPLAAPQPPAHPRRPPTHPSRSRSAAHRSNQLGPSALPQVWLLDIRALGYVHDGSTHANPDKPGVHSSSCCSDRASRPALCLGPQPWTHPARGTHLHAPSQRALQDTADCRCLRHVQGSGCGHHAGGVP